MTKWLHTLNLCPEWKQAEDEVISFTDMAAIVAQRLKTLDFGANFNGVRDELVELFENVAVDKAATVEDFNYAMNELYDFGDLHISDSEGLDLTTKIIIAILYAC